MMGVAVTYAGKLRAGAAVVGASLCLSACVSTGTKAPAQTPAQKAAFEQATRHGGPPADLEAYARELAMAVAVLSECTNELKLNESYVQGMGNAFENKYGTPLKRSYPREVERSGEMKSQDYFIAFVNRNRVLVSDPQSWCRAGRNEIARKSGVGKNLLAK